MKKIKSIVLIVTTFFVSHTMFAQGIPKPSAACDSLLEKDINIAFITADSTGELFDALYSLGANEYPQSTVGVYTITGGDLTVMSIGGKFPKITEVTPAKEWVHAENGCPTYVALSPNQKLMLRLIYEE